MFAVVADLLLSGGEALVFVFALLADQGGLVYLLLSRLLSAAPQLAWLPTDQLQTAFTVVSLLLAVVALVQLIRSTRESISDRS